jgi:putative PEP-CTERM system TPR-repeat lipoprotein
LKNLIIKNYKKEINHAKSGSPPLIKDKIILKHSAQQITRSIMKVSLLLKTITCSLILLLIAASCGPQTKEELFKKGISAADDGNLRGAIVLFRSAIEKDANFWEARYRLADAYMRIGRYDQAEKEFEKVARQNPAIADLPLKFGELFTLTGRTDKAIGHIEDYLSSYPENYQAMVILGRAHLLKNDHDMAQFYLRRALDLDRKNTSAMLYLAELLLRQNNEEAAWSYAEEVIAIDRRNAAAHRLLARLEMRGGDRQRALELYRRVTLLEPGDIESRFIAGLILIEFGQLEQAEESAGHMLELFPASHRGQQLKGFVQYGRGNFDEAIRQFHKAIDVEPSLLSWQFLGLCYFQLGKFELALNQFNKVLDFRPQSLQARLMVGMTLLRQRRIEDAIREIRRTIQLDNKNALAHHLLGSALMADGHYDEATAAFEIAVELNPALAEGRLGRGIVTVSSNTRESVEEETVEGLEQLPDFLENRLLLVTQYLSRQNYAAAMRVLKDGMRGTESDAVLYNYMAAVHFAQKNPEEAVRFLQKAKLAKSDYLTPYFNLAAYHTSRREYAEAVKEYQAILAVNSTDVRALLQLGLTWELAGDDQEAVRYFTAAKNTRDPRGYLSLANHYMKKGDSASALAVISDGLLIHAEEGSLLEFLGRIKVFRKKYDEAITVFQRLEQVRPGIGLPLLVGTLLHQGQFDKAEELAVRIIRMNPVAATGYLLLAMTREQRGDLDKAIAVLRDGVSKTGGDIQMEMHIAALYERKADFPGAEATYEKIRRNHPHYYPAIFALGAVRDRLGDKREALKFYQETLSKAADYTPALNNLAYLYADNFGSREEALALALRAFRNEPGNAAVMDTLGYVLLRNGRIDEAGNLLAKAAALLPENPAVHYHLALVHMARGDGDAAADLLRRSLQLGEFSGDAEAVKLLKQLDPTREAIGTKAGQ